MKKQNKREYIPRFSDRALFLFAALGFGLFTYAQKAEKDTTLNRTTVVENEYTPYIIDASKINVLPGVEEPVAVKKGIEYSTEELPATSFGTYQVMPSLAEKPLQKNTKRGYVRLGYGNYGNIDGKLSYLFDFSKKDRLGLSASLDGMNGTLKQFSPYGEEPKSTVWKSRHYNSDFRMDYTHLFNKVSLNFTGNLGLGNFNYAPNPSVDQSWTYNTDVSDKQHQIEGQLGAALVSSDEALFLQFTTETRYLYFSRKYDSGMSMSDKEQIMQMKANVWGQISQEQNVGLKIDMDNFFYSSSELDNYTSLQMNPYYTFDGDSWKLRIGAHVDFAFGKGNIIEASPDINIDYVFADSYALYFNVGGGRILNDYRQLKVENPYWTILSPSEWKNSYLPLDAGLGLKASPFPGFWLHLNGRYQIRNNDLCFTDYISQYNPYIFSYFIPSDTKVLYAGLELKYAYKNALDFIAKGTYYQWYTKEKSALLMKPEFELCLKANIKATSGLYVNLGYDYVTRPEVTLERLNGYSVTVPYNYRMKAISNLNLGVTYTLWNSLSAYVKLNNILNWKYQYYYAYPVEKINFLAGLSFSF